jgi:hypothetical protein
MNIKINDKKYSVKPFSQLSVMEYVQIVDKVRYVDLVSYISALVGFEIDSANVEMKNIEVAEHLLLDADIDFSKIDMPNIFEYNKGLHITTQMDKGTFGNKYVFNLYRRQFDSEQISIVMLCVYALAITLSKEDEYADIDEIVMRLMRMSWQVILPIGFFLCKKLSNKKMYLTIFLKKLIVRLLYSMKSIKMKVTRMT